MANSNGDLETDIQSLSTIFKEGMDNYNRVVNSELPTNSPDVQVSHFLLNFVLLYVAVLLGLKRSKVSTLLKDFTYSRSP